MKSVRRNHFILFRGRRPAASTLRRGDYRPSLVGPLLTLFLSVEDGRTTGTSDADCMESYEVDVVLVRRGDLALAKVLRVGTTLGIWVKLRS